MNFQEWLKARKIEHDKLTDDQRAVLKVAFENENARGITSESPSAEDIATDEEKERQALDGIRLKETQRVDAIRRLAKSFQNIVPQDVVDRCTREGFDINQTREVFLEHIRKTGLNPAKNPSNPGSVALRQETLVDALLLRGGFEDVVTKGVNGAQRAELAEKIRSISLQDVCHQALEMESRDVPVDRNEIIHRAFSTALLTNILSAVANKALLRGYVAQNQTWRTWCNIGTASDYKTMNRVRLTDVGDLLETPVDGEVKHGSAVDENETFVIARYAKRFSVDEITIKNDDLSALTRVPQALGNRAAALVSKLVYTHLLGNSNMADGTALFVAGHSNLNTSCALTATNLATAMAAFLGQTDKDSQPIDVMPKILLVPPGLWEAARVLTESDLMIAVGVGSSAAKAGNISAFRGILKAVVEPRLANSAYTGSSSTSWYLIGDPAVCDTIEVAFLDGVQTPVIERFDAGESRFGITWRVRIDAGCKAIDHRTMSLNQA